MNAFLEASDQMLSRGAKRRLEKLVIKSEKEAAKALSPMEKAQQETSVQFRKYEKWRREKRDEVFAKVHELKALVKNLKPVGSQDFIAFFQARDWSDLDRNERIDVLAVVDDAIVKMRIQHGMPPLDDSLPGQLPRVFEVIRKLLTGVGQ